MGCVSRVVGAKEERAQELDEPEQAADEGDPRSELVADEESEASEGVEGETGDCKAHVDREVDRRSEPLQKKSRDHLDRALPSRTRHSLARIAIEGCGRVRSRMSLAKPLFAALALSSLACETEVEGASGNICQQAADVIEDCGGVVPEEPVEGCVGSFSEAAEHVVEVGCEALDGRDGKSDAFWCSPVTRWLGLCDIVPLETAAAVADVATVCPSSRGDDLCSALRSGDDELARSLVRSKVESEPRSDVVADPAVQYWIRERTAALLVWNVARSLDSDPAAPAFVDWVFEELFPAYDPAVFEMAHRPLAPETPGCSETTDAAILFFPGVVRLGNRDEFTEQGRAVEDALPCVRTYTVDTGSFVEPAVNAQRGRLAFDLATQELGEVPVHLVGYSQGSTNALTTLVDVPDVAARATSVLVMNSAAHGSEVADTLGGLISALDGTYCESVAEFARPACEWADDRSPVPNDLLMETIAFAMGIPVESLADFIAAEDSIAAAPTVKDFFAAHTPGVQSLSTPVAAEFWRERADALPRDTLYYSFRSVISDPVENLPLSNKLFFALLERAGESEPYNDMQVRLENQELGGRVADIEVVGPVAEGNHWQWELATGAVPEAVMPAEMTEKIPHREFMVAYFQTLAEAGLLLADK